MKKEVLYVDGMSCESCKQKIEKALKSKPGVLKANVNLSQKTITLHYDEIKVSIQDINQVLNELGYALLTQQQKKNNQEQAIQILLLAFLAFILINRLIPDTSQLLTSNESLSLVVLFIIGLTTSFHCVSMCGGLALSQVISQKYNLKRNVNYNLGRVISYTVLGGFVGAIGSTITVEASIFKFVPIILGIFMLLFGLEKLNFIKLNKLGIFKPFNKKLEQFKSKLGHDQGPFVLGLLNGFMPCGPLQLMQFYALGTGSAVLGALSMFAFSLGTVPLMVGLGVMITKVSTQARSLIFKLGSALIIFLGINMISNGFTTMGININPFTTPANSSSQSGEVKMVDGYQVIEFDLAPRNYADITVVKDIPVKLIINANQGTLNGCNRSLNMQAFGISKDLNTGKNEIIFTPTQTGNFTYSCWMGMIRNTIKVVNN